MNETTHVMIAGGGLGGLCLAQSLKRQGVRVSVFERDASWTARRQGYRIHISPAGGRALREALPAELFDYFVRTCGEAGQGFTMLTEQLQEIVSFVDRGSSVADPHGDLHRSVSRITLRRLLLSGLADSVQFDKRLRGFTQEPSGRISLDFEDGSTAQGDLLVGADGVNSAVRCQYMPNAGPIATGVLAIGGRLKLTDGVMALLPAQLLDGPAIVLPPEPWSLFMAIWRRSQAAQGALEELATRWPVAGEVGRTDDLTEDDYVVMGFGAKPEELGVANGDQDDPRALLHAIQQRTDRWHPNLRKLCHMLAPSAVATTKLQTSLPMAPWSPSRVTLLGDAIHSMTPYRGIGANIALKDAALLGRKIGEAVNGGSDLVTAIGGYEEEMRQYAFAAVKDSRETMERSVGQRGAGFGMMKAALRVVNAVPSIKRQAIARMVSG